MRRSIGAVILGYVVMAAAVFVTFTLAYLIMGADVDFKPDSYEVSGLWLVASLVLGLIAAVMGGLICASVARGSRAPLALAGLVLVLGLLMAFAGCGASDTEESQVRSGDVGNFEAMQKANEPDWMKLINPFIGAVGVLFGSRWRRPA